MPGLKQIAKPSMGTRILDALSGIDQTQYPANQDGMRFHLMEPNGGYETMLDQGIHVPTAIHNMGVDMSPETYPSRVRTNQLIDESERLLPSQVAPNGLNIIRKVQK